MPESTRRRLKSARSELRKNLITREWVIIARGRKKRPSDFAKKQPPRIPISPQDRRECAFCPGNEAVTGDEVFAIRDGSKPNRPGWRVRVVPNKYPALRAGKTLKRGEVGPYDLMDGTGFHEVIIESPEHDQDLWQMSNAQVEAVVSAYRQRLIDLGTRPTIEYVLIFRNHGERAGTSMIHPHSQVIATPVIPHQVMDEVEGVARFYEYMEECPFCVIIEQELRSKDRIVFQTDHFLVATSFAGRYPYETRILPKRHQPDFKLIGKTELKEFARVLKRTLAIFATALDDPSYNYALHTAPQAEYRVPTFHWHLEIYPRMTTLGGFELGSQIYINSVPPEDAARRLRKADGRRS